MRAKLKSYIKPYYYKLRDIKQNTYEYFDKRRMVTGHFNYSIVSAVYNVEKYLDTYFESLIAQTIDFRKHLHIIMVDDGSTDNSAKIIKKWQTRYPENILYLHKENGGQASARNLGMAYVKTEWVTFIDPDDFVQYRYFEEVDRFLFSHQHLQIGLVSCNTRYFDENSHQYRDNFYLSFCFQDTYKIVKPSDMKGCMQFSASSSFFRNSLLQASNIQFDHIKPNFEDAHFVNQYFIENNEIDIAYLKKANYIYRRRSDGTSSMNKAWQSTEKYIDVLKNGYLDLLLKAQKKFGTVPLYIQRTILSELTGYFKNILNNPSKIKHLNEKEKKTFISLIEEMFQYIDIQTIEKFHIFGTSHMDRVGFLGAYKNTQIQTQKCFIDNYNANTNELRIQFFYYFPPSELSFFIDGRQIYARQNELKSYNFVGKLFVYEKTVWIPLVAFNKLTIKAENQDLCIMIDGKTYTDGITIDTILQSNIVQKKMKQKYWDNQKILLKKIIKKVIFYDKLKQSKNTHLIPAYKKRKVLGDHQFTIVSAVYNVENYLEEYFSSIINQSLLFENHIHLIMVDDGSPDQSADIIKKWQKRYPDNITYIKKENGGQASARNVGMEYVRTEWVTFIDPDDFLDYRYFEEVDRFLSKQDANDISMISCNFIFYYDKSKSLSDTHPLKYRFRKNENVINVSTMHKDIQLTVNSVFFKKNQLSKHQICFHTDIRPSFEDGYFVTQYLIHNYNTKIAFLKGPKYYYRKRSDGTSTLDTSWKTIDRYDKVLRNGYLRILRYAEDKMGFVPQFLQRTILYELMWNHQYLLNSSQKISHLSVQEKQQYQQLLKETFEYLDMETIENFELAGCWFFYKVAYIGFYKHKELPYQIYYIEGFDAIKSQIKIHYFYYYENEATVTLNKKSIEPIYTKTRTHEFIGQDFVYEKTLWVSFENLEEYCEIQTNNKQTIFSLKGTQYKYGIRISAIKNSLEQKTIHQSKIKKNIKTLYYRAYFYIIGRIAAISNRGSVIWLIGERVGTSAQDTGYHFFRYCRKYHPSKKIYFVTKKENITPELSKLDNILEMGTIKHHILLLSSQVHIFNDSYRDLCEKWENVKKTKQVKVVCFLQHGIIALSKIHGYYNYTNMQKRANAVDIFITSSEFEKDVVINKLGHKDERVFISGLSRFDNLFEHYHIRNKKIIYIPTWRNWLRYCTEQEFLNSKYYKETLNVVNAISQLKQHYKFEFDVCFHHAFNKFTHLYKHDEEVNFIDMSHINVQELIIDAGMLITDYSSISFDFAFMEKPVVFYQFDREEFLEARGGSFINHETELFGPVTTNLDTLSSYVQSYIDNKYQMYDNDKEKASRYFEYRDNKNSQRIFDIIENTLEQKSSI